QVCQNFFGNFQEILQGRQQPGRFHRNTGMKLSKQHVFTKTECLDICLRTAECGSFDMKQMQSNNTTKTFWVCIINRRVNSQGTIPEVSRQSKPWIHFTVSSQDLQEVSCFRNFETQ
ncbi:hypothetical protein ACROYT_G027939, partial [Oculina patagonica]